MSTAVNPPGPPPLIVSLQLDPGLFAAVDGLRRQHFPPARNVLPAHVTLFHHLPGEREPDVSDRLTAACTALGPMPLTLASVRFLGYGVAIHVECEPLCRLRAEFARAWRAWLTPQDRQGFRPHVTVQNKVTVAAARILYDRLTATWTPLVGEATGLMLWRYRGGPWEPAGTFPFGPGPAVTGG